MRPNHLGRKFWAFIISLVAICVCAAFHLDVSLGIGTLFGLYCAGNVGAKITNRFSENEAHG